MVNWLIFYWYKLTLFMIEVSHTVKEVQLIGMVSLSKRSLLKVLTQHLNFATSTNDVQLAVDGDGRHILHHHLSVSNDGKLRCDKLVVGGTRRFIGSHQVWLDKTLVCRRQNIKSSPPSQTNAATQYMYAIITTQVFVIHSKWDPFWVLRPRQTRWTLMSRCTTDGNRQIYEWMICEPWLANCVPKVTRQRFICKWQYVYSPAIAASNLFK